VNEYRFVVSCRLDQLDGINNRITHYVQSQYQDLPESWLEEVRLIATEIFANLCQHAQLDEHDNIQYCLQTAEGKLHLWIRDNGAIWNPRELTAPSLEKLQEHGYGFYLIRTLSDRIEYTRQELAEFKNNLLIVKSFPHA
jgi:serine/threonine-protein kinase RsbW